MSKSRNEHVIRRGFNSFWDGFNFQKNPKKAKVFRDGQKARKLIKRWRNTPNAFSQAIPLKLFNKIYNLNLK